jgi:endonuclease-3
MQADKIYSILKKIYPAAKIALIHSNPLQLLIAVILSAQCTDKRVNIVTKELFKKYRKAEDYAYGDLEELKRYIKSTGFYNNKAKNIQNARRIIVEKHKGKVPNTMEGLLELPGVARKTANIVLSNAYGINSGIAVDTHVMRLSQRLGFSKNKTPEKIEIDLMKIFPKSEWNKVTYYLIEHGRAVCKAPVPFCSRCPVETMCPKIGVSKKK